MTDRELADIKMEMRREARQKLDAIPAQVRDRQSRALTDMITSTEMYQDAQYILTYLSSGNEVDTWELVRRSLKDGKKVYAPKILSEETMEFYEVDDINHLKKNKMGIYEPDESPAALFPYQIHISLDRAQQCIMFVPGLAFDGKLRRLGRGRGYYDRYLRRLRKKMSIGLAFNEQMVQEVPADSRDETLDLIVTEQGAYF